MIINGVELLRAAPIKNMLTCKESAHGVSYGLSEAGYDIRIKQTIIFNPYEDKMFIRVEDVTHPHDDIGRFTIASAIEEFQMPPNMVGIVHDKSTWARRGLSVFNTVIECSWHGFLTLELVYHGSEKLVIPAGAGIAQVVFHDTTSNAYYDGKYQNQEDRPVSARESV